VLRQGALKVRAGPSRTHKAPSTQGFSWPRPYSRGALRRWPSIDQPGAGAKARALTGPNSSRRTPCWPSMKAA
jgi:hypothetical protein